MSEQNHPWCRDVSRDEAIRAAEDAAAAERTPPPDHRDLPSAVHDLRRRVEGLEAVADHWRRQCEADAEKREAAVVSREGVNADGLRTERVTLEIALDDAGYRVHAMIGEILSRFPSVRVVDEATVGSGDVFADVGCGSTGDEIVRLTAELDAAKEECERLRHLLKTKESECETHHPWVHPSAAPAANAGGEAKPEPVAWGVNWGDHWGGEDSFSTAHVYRKRKWAKTVASTEPEATLVPLYAAPQPPRGWLTRHERWRLGELVAWLKGRAAEHTDTIHGGLCESYAADIDALLARFTPPRVKVPKAYVEAVEVYRDMVIAAIRAAGAEVAE